MDNILNFSKIFASISNWLDNTFTDIQNYLSHLNTSETIAIILFLMTLILILSLVLVWYVKSIISSIQRERTLEREYRAKIDNRLNKKILPIEETEDTDIKNQEIISNDKKKTPVNLDKNSLPFDFDWKKSNIDNGEKIKIQTPDVFQYQFKPQKLTTLIALIMDMLQRNVDEPKIAQTIMYKNQHLNSEDDIIQTITAVKFFIYLCVNGRFQNLNPHKTLPQEDAALFHLANGDCSLALVLMEELIDKKITQAKVTIEENKSHKIWCEASNYATIFGSLAALTNNSLAAQAFELAIEMNPRNVTAWGRLGDMYFREDNQEKALWAYSNVLNIADEGIYTQQIANANKSLATHYSETGNRDLAANMLKNATQFYDTIGINKPLTKQEVKIIDLIEIRQFENIEKIIDNLFLSKHFKQTGYV